MSVLIKGIEMPKNCAVCRLEKDIFGRAVCFGYEDGRALHEDDLPPVGNEERRPSWCPLVEIPPHGRLIDADELRWFYDNSDVADDVITKENYDQLKVAVAIVRQTIDDAPTIIEAEEGELRELK